MNSREKNQRSLEAHKDKISFYYQNTIYGKFNKHFMKVSDKWALCLIDVKVLLRLIRHPKPHPQA